MSESPYIQTLRSDCSELLDWAPSSPSAASKTPLQLKKILLFGDSLVELASDPRIEFPFSAALSHIFRRRADVITRAAAGYTSRWLSQEHLDRVSAELSSQSLSGNLLSLAVIWVGTNDSVLPGNPHHVPVSEYEKNLLKIISAIIESSTKGRENDDPVVIYVVTPPPCSLELINGPNSRLSASGRARSNQAVEQYVSAVYRVVDQIKTVSSRKAMIEIIDMYETIQNLAQREKQKVPIETFLVDGVHFNGDGYRLLFKSVFKRLEELEAAGTVTFPLVEPHFSVKIQKDKEEGLI